MNKNFRLPETDLQTTPFHLQTSPPVRLTTTPETSTTSYLNVFDSTTAPLPRPEPYPERTQSTTSIRDTVTPAPEHQPTTRVQHNRSTRPTGSPPSRQKYKPKEKNSATKQVIVSLTATLFMVSLLIWL